MNHYQALAKGIQNISYALQIFDPGGYLHMTCEYCMCVEGVGWGERRIEVDFDLSIPEVICLLVVTQRDIFSLVTVLIHHCASFRRLKMDFYCVQKGMMMVMLVLVFQFLIDVFLSLYIR